MLLKVFGNCNKKQDYLSSVFYFHNFNISLSVGFMRVLVLSFPIDGKFLEDKMNPSYIAFSKCPHVTFRTVVYL